jgi:hypothetical protein
VGLWHAEETHQAIAEKLVDMAPKASHRGGGDLLVVFRDPMPIFGIEARGDLDRADEITEQHGELAALARRQVVRC